MYTHIKILHIHILLLVAHLSYVHFIVVRMHVKEATTIELNQQWKACLEAFLRSFSRSGSADSFRYYGATLRAFFLMLRRNPKHATRTDVENFMWQRIEPGRRNAGELPSPGTRNVRISVIASFYRFASDYVPDGHYEPIYSGRLPTTGIKTSQRDIQYRGMSPEEVERFFSVIDCSTLIGKRDYAIFLMLYLTARRLREIADLCYGDICYETIIDDSERRQAWVYKFRNKGRKGQEDSAELSQLAKDAIDEYLEASGRLPLAPDDPLFTASVPRVDYDPYAPLVSTSIRHRMKLYCQYAGLDARRLSPHAFRHASSQHRLANGEKLEDLNYLLRHVSMDTTMRYARGLISRADPGLSQLETRFRDT